MRHRRSEQQQYHQCSAGAMRLISTTETHVPSVIKLAGVWNLQRSSGSRVGAFVGHAVGLLVRAAVAVGDFVGASSHQ